MENKGKVYGSSEIEIFYDSIQEDGIIHTGFMSGILILNLNIFVYLMNFFNKKKFNSNLLRKKKSKPNV